MKLFYLPKNVWRKIKGFEFQLLYPKEIQIKSLENIKLVINSNYFFSIDSIFIPKFKKKIDFDYHYDYLKHNYPEYWKIFTDTFIKKYIMKHNDLFYHHQRYTF